MQSLGCNLQAAVRDIHPNHLGEAFVFENLPQKFAFAASQIEYAPCADRAQGLNNGSHALLPELQGRLDLQLCRCVLLLVGIGIGIIFFRKTGESFACEMVAMAQIALYDGFLFRMRSQPSLSTV